jgi:hypothetical protein
MGTRLELKPLAVLGDLVGDRGLVEVHLALGAAYSLLGDAAVGYQAGLDLSAVLLCRASLEAALHATLSIRNPQFSSRGVLTELEPIVDNIVMPA